MSSGSRSRWDPAGAVRCRDIRAGAGVTAAFDSTTNKLSLTTTYNTEDNVPISSDTPGFLAAAGISSVDTIRGNIRDNQQVLSKTTQFGSMTTGSFTINGVAISVNKDTETPTSVINRIDNAGAGGEAEPSALADRTTSRRHATIPQRNGRNHPGRDRFAQRLRRKGIKPQQQQRRPASFCRPRKAREGSRRAARRTDRPWRCNRPAARPVHRKGIRGRRSADERRSPPPGVKPDQGFLRG